MKASCLTSCLLAVFWYVPEAVADANMAAALKVQYQLLQPSDAECPSSKLRKEPGCYLSRLSLTLPFASNNSGWKIYFSQLTPVIAATHPQLQIRHLNGDLHELRGLCQVCT